VQVYPALQTVGPVQFEPPHWPKAPATPVEVGEDDVVIELTVVELFEVVVLELIVEEDLDVVELAEVLVDTAVVDAGGAVPLASP